MIGVVFIIVHTKLSRFLLSYRSAPNTTMGRTPSELLLKCLIRTRLDLLKPSIYETITHNQSQQKHHYDKRTKMCTFEIGEHVLVQNFRGAPKWLSGVIVGTAGNVSYQVRVESQIWNRHVYQLLQGTISPITPRSGSSDIIPCSTEGTDISQDTQNTS